MCGFFEDRCAWYRVPGPGHLAPGTRDRINAEGRIPSTEDRVGRPGSPLSVHMWSTFSPRGGPRTWVHVRGSPCPGTSGNLWRSTPDGGNHVELCDRHVETRGPKGIRIHWGVPTFHGAASQTSRRGIPGGGFLSPLFVSGVPGRVKSRLGSPPSWGSRGRTSERSGPGVPRRLQSAGRPQGRDPIQPCQPHGSTRTY
jgi:hypothetical protein